jgi:hypothetical protein
MVRDAAHDPDKIAIWERAVKVQAMLATRLRRLAPQSRVDPKTIGRPQHGARPWDLTKKPLWED